LRNDLAGYATRKNRNGVEHTRARKPLHVGKVPNGVRLENLLRR